MGYTQLENRLRDRCVEHLCSFLSGLDRSEQPEEKHFALIDRILNEVNPVVRGHCFEEDDDLKEAE